jgi:hypothetical protein
MASESHKEVMMNSNEMMGNWFRKDVQYSQFQVRLILLKRFSGFQMSG